MTELTDTQWIVQRLRRLEELEKLIDAIPWNRLDRCPWCERSATTLKAYGEHYESCQYQKTQKGD